MYEPKVLKTAQINLNSWVSVEDVPQAEKDAILAQE